MSNRMLSCVLFISFLSGGVDSSAQQKPHAQTPTNYIGDISGMYTFRKDGEYVQITVNPQDKSATKEVSGFISRYGDEASDKDLFLDHFFTEGKLKDTELTFKTRVVHGVSYEFTGVASRNPKKKANEEGYLEIRGMLTKKKTSSDKTTSEEEQLTMRLFPNLNGEAR